MVVWKLDRLERSSNFLLDLVAIQQHSKVSKPFCKFDVKPVYPVVARIERCASQVAQ